MSEWTIKRFWSVAEAVPAGEGWTVQLDGRPVRTPARAALVVPTQALAQELAAEWDAQEEKVDPAAMPLTRTANSALDKVAPQYDGVVSLMLEYGGTDLLCYRADSPEELSAAQAAAWDPLMDWARAGLGAPLIATAGIMPQPQPGAALDALRARVDGQDLFALTALHDLVTLSGSLVIGLAAQQGVLAPEELWTRSRVDEDWQESQWGRDAEAAEMAAAKRADFLRAARFHALSRPDG